MRTKHLVLALTLGITGIAGWAPTAAAWSGRTPAHAASTRFEYDEDVFLAKNRIVATEGFDVARTFSPEKKTVVFTKLLLTSTDPADPYWLVSGGSLFREFRTGSDQADLLIRAPRGTVVNAIGFRIDAFGTPNQFTITVKTIDGRRMTRLAPSNVDQFYVGVSDRLGIERIIISQCGELADGVTSNFAIDDLARSALRTLG